MAKKADLEKYLDYFTEEKGHTVVSNDRLLFLPSVVNDSDFLKGYVEITSTLPTLVVVKWLVVHLTTRPEISG
ncbi:hypothetical protein Bca4012_063925 [Brassica carinata]|uniref:Uncharacterized protein n=1 Tax=Brassica carinata TaxID=52824 RepID=A0A8X7SCT1_BRACI|nr:hypothetical protein Bca52824_033579 [Brassica carinata]